MVADKDIHAVSGIEVQHHSSLHSSPRPFWLTVCPVPIVHLEKYEIYVASSDTISLKTVVWTPSKYHSHLELTKNDDFKQFLSQFLTNGFSLFPHNSTSTGVPEVTVVALTPQGPKKPLRRGERLMFGSAAPHSEVSITSFPFSFTNPVLFADFQSHGFVNYVHKFADTPAVYLSDAKYLENMAGGLVRLDSDEAIGLVIGNLRKRNGDGDLTLIGGWELFAGFVEMLFDAKIGLSNFINTVPVSAGGSSFSVPVFPIVVTGAGSRSWGTCTFVSNVLVTNFHVLKSFIEAPNGTSSCVVSVNSRTVRISHEDDIVTPFPQLDLSFIILSKSNRVLFDGTPHLSTAKPTLNQEAYSFGYGLFFSPRQTAPLVAKGHISVSASLPLSDRATRSDPSISSMIVTSAPCWNGSSGGALVDADNNLLGIICCNAQVRVPELAGTNSSATEKVSTFCMCLPIELVLRSIDSYMDKTISPLNPDIGKLWTLTPTHQDIIEGVSKL